MRHVLFTLIILLTSSNALAQENRPQDQSVFTPTKLNGKPVKVVGVLQYKFTQR